MPTKPHGNKKDVTVPFNRTSDDRFEQIYQQALSIQEVDAMADDAIGFMARAMIQATLPHRKVDGNEFVRVNGNYTLTINAPSSVGLPYGSVPRLLLAWITTEAVKTKSPELELGESLSDFTRSLGLTTSGGRKGDITRLKDQINRLTASSFNLIYNEKNGSDLEHFHVIRRSSVWWKPNQPDQFSLWNSSLTLTQEFFEEVTDNPVPIDIRALKALKQSPMALDLYMWLTYRMSYLKKPVDVPWESLIMQLGSSYADTPAGRQGFRRAMVEALKKVSLVYPLARVQESTTGLLIKPSPTHISKRRK